MSEPALRRPAPPGPSDTDPVAHSTGVVSESEHESLRADIRRLSTMLGQTLACVIAEPTPSTVALGEPLDHILADDAL